MDPLETDPLVSRQASRRKSIEEFALPSRVAAIDAIRHAIRMEAGPALLTGEAGVGKSWLWRRLCAERLVPWRWLSVDLAPSTDPRGFYRLLGHKLGLAEIGGPSKARSILSDFLHEGRVEGANWVFVIDEAHNMSAEVGEEIRILTNVLGGVGGFSSILIVGQTELARRVNTRPLAALGTRLAARVTLQPLDIQESSTFLEKLYPGKTFDLQTLERLHCEAWGNPKRLLQATQQLAVSFSPSFAKASPKPVRDLWAEPVVVARPVAVDEPSYPRADREPPVLGTPRPPLREEEGVIEVGWEPPQESEASDDSVVLELTDGQERSAMVRLDAPGAFPEGDEAVDDHYAALRAWSEWATNQGRAPLAATPAAALQAIEPEDVSTEASETRSEEPATAATPPNTWAEGQHGFAPYSQLFSRIRQPRDSK